jgi:hypothetical protein
MNTYTTHRDRARSALTGAVAIIVAGLILLVPAWGAGASAHNHGSATMPTMDMAKHKAETGHEARARHKAKAKRVKTRRAAVKKRNLYLAMRSLWSEHMEWTYATVTAFVTDSPGLGATMDRLLQNQKDIGNAIRPYYGKAAGNELTALLTEHIQDAVPVLVAARDGDANALGTAVTAWYANAREIGNFLAGANPAWKGARGMMKMHITQTVAYASDQLQGDWARSIEDYSEAEAHMLMMGDQLSAGIIKQFPRRFR